MGKQHLKELADKFFSGTATEVEKRYLHQWYDDHLSSHDRPLEVHEDERILKGRIYAKLLDDIGHSEQKYGKAKARKYLFRFSSAAAIIVLAVSAWALFGIVRPKDKVIHVAHGERVQVELPDGSSVWLNSGSTFKYPEKFGAKERKVELIEGQAFFDVQQRVDAPFIVNSNGLKISVLGTSFDVKSYAAEKNVRVHVLSGKVGVDLESKTVLLTKDEELILDRSTGEIAKNKIDPVATSSWRDNRFTFDDATLEEIFLVLERTYDVHFRVKQKEILSERVSIKLDQQPLKNILEILSYTKQFEYEWTDEHTIAIK